MDALKEEGEFVGNSEEPVKEAGEELGVPVKNETLGGKVDVQVDDCNGDANSIEDSGSGACNSGDVGVETDEKTNGGENHGGDRSGEVGLGAGEIGLEVEGGDKDSSVSEEKKDKADVGRAEEMSGSVDAEATDYIAKLETESENVERDDDSERAEKLVSPAEVETKEAVVEPVDERGNAEPCDDAERGEKTVIAVESEMTDDTLVPEIESKNDEIHETVGKEKTTVSSIGSEVTDEKAKCDVEVKNADACNAGQDAQAEEPQISSSGGDVGETKDVDAEKSSDTTVIKGGEEKESAQKGEEDNNKMDVDSENEIREVKDEKVGPLSNEQKNPESETSDGKPSESVQTAAIVDGEELKAQEGNPCDSTKESSAAETCPEDQTTDINQKEEKGEAMEIDSVEEELVKKADTLGDVENAGKECVDANTVENQDVPKGDTDQHDSIVEKKIEVEAKSVEEQKDNNDTKRGVTDKIVSKESQDVPKAEADQDDTNGEKKMEMEEKNIEEQKDKDDTTGDVADKIVSKDSRNHDIPVDASTGEVEQMEHNVLFDPNSDIANYIDFSGVSSWSGNIQEIKTDTGNVSGEESTEVTDTTKEVATVNVQEGLKPDIEAQGSVENVRESVLDESKDKDTTTDLESRDQNTVDEMEIDTEGGDSGNVSLGAEGIEKEPNETHVSGAESQAAAAADHQKKTSDADLGSFLGEENQEEKGQECLDKKTEDHKDTITEEEDDVHEAPNVDPNQMHVTEMEDELKGSEHDEGTDSDTKTNGVKRKADALGEDSSPEVRKTISVAKVSVSPSHLQRPSFKIGACIARAASQMAGPPSILKGSGFGDDLSVDNFLSQLQSAATDPEKENIVSEIAAGFFLDYRNSVASQQLTPDKVCGKRGRPSNSNIAGTEAFEFEEMSDTYWTDRVIHNGGEEQTPPSEKGTYQIVPVELKPAQIQRSRRPYTKRKHAESNNNNSHSASGKPAGFDENAPAELIMNFSEMDTIPSEMSLNKMFRHFGSIRESQTEVDRDTSRARVVFKKCADAEVAYSSAGKFNIFGTKVVNYELSYTITEPFKIQPYVVTLGEEDGGLCLPSQS